MSKVLRKDQIVDGYSDENGNRIIGTPQVSAHAFIEFKSRGCTVTFSAGSKFHGAIFFQRENSTLDLGARSLLTGRTALGADCAIIIGEDVYSGANLQLTTAEGQSISIGDDCLIANDVRIRADDSHPIYDMRTGKRVNESASVSIGSHVWIGQEAFLMPGSQIGVGCIIGARSMTTKSRPIGANSIALGSPAKITRRDVHWVRKHLQIHTDVPAKIDPMIAEPPAEVSRNVPRSRFLGWLWRSSR